MTRIMKPGATPHRFEPENVQELEAVRDLWDDRRRALLAFAERDVHELAIGRWRFTARPVRASRDECLTCHGRRSTSPYVDPSVSGSQLKTGDPLGVVIYGYRPLP